MKLAFSRTREVDEPRAHPLQEGMSRLLRPLAFSLAALALALAGCRTSTPYTRMYSPRKNYYTPPVPKSEKSAEELLAATEAAKSATGPAIPGGPPPADAIPGLPPAAAPAADPLAPAPAPVPPAN